MKKYYLPNMYNKSKMEISIGTYKFRLEIVLLIIVVAWILFGHLLCSCCRLNFNEGFVMATDTISNELNDSGIFPNKIMEGFVSAGKNNTSGAMAAPPFAPDKAPGWFKPPSTWGLPNLEYTPGTTPDKGVDAILNRPAQPVPLPPGEMDMFATTEFKPECCSNTYSSSTGCACMTVNQYDYLRARGGNNVPYSEY